MGNPVGLFQHCIPMETVPFASLFGLTVPAPLVLPQFLYCWAGMWGGSAGQACKTLGWGPKETCRAGRAAGSREAVTENEERARGPRCVVQGGWSR